jgi:DNA-binding transcriptional LysR family regulator
MRSAEQAFNSAIQPGSFAFMQRSPRSAAPLERRLRWDDARILLSLLGARSLLAAGKELGLNASTIGRRLDALEETLGARLFDRTPEGVLPTALADELAPHAREMQRAAQALAMTAQGREVLPEGDVHITAPPGYTEYLLAPAMPRLIARHAGLRVTLSARAQVLDLTRREADIAVRSARPTSGDLVARKLGGVHSTLMASPKYVAQIGTLRRITDARWITWGSDLASVAPARFVAAHVPEASIVLRTSHLGTQVAAAEAGLGVILADRNLIAVRKLALVPLASDVQRLLPDGAGELWLVGHRALRDVPRIAATWDFLIGEAKRLGLT